jgi:LDH2 family malate/lactate/ureidoglycolate dehydrogenase
MPEGDVRVDIAKLHDLGVRALVAAGAREEHARWTADVLLASDLRGVESHGFAHLADFYVARLRNGTLKADPDIRVVQETASAATIDADGGLGFAGGHVGMLAAVDKARSSGVGMAAVRNSGHYGPGFYYAMLALAHDMVGLSLTTGGNIIVPPGGKKRTYGANVIAFAAQTREAPFVLDMSTSVVAGGKFEIARRRGQSVPAGWGLGPEGEPITDPNLYFQGGAILPLGSTPEMGAYKGFGLALMVDVLCGLLSEGGASVELRSGQANHFFAALRIDAFGTKEAFLDRMEEMKRRLRAAPRQEGAPPLSIPGEPEAALEAENRRLGVPLHPTVIEALRGMAAELGIEFGL